MKLEMIKLSDIDFGDRRREEYGDIVALAHSISERGLICPIAVQEANGGYLLAAGGRRFRACESLGMETIACRVYDKPLTQLQFREIELYENLHREDLTYAEEVKMKKELLELEQTVKGIKVGGTAEAGGASLRSTASLLGKSPGSISQDIKLARAMEEYPDLDWSACKNKSEAHRMLKQIGRRMEYIAASDKIEEMKLQSLGIRQQKLIDSYLVGDFFEHAPQLPDNYFNLIEIDPPYAIELDKIKKRTGMGDYRYSEDSYNEVSPQDYPDFMQQTLSHAYRVAAENSWLIVWFAPEPWAEDVYRWITAAGFRTKRIYGHWVKPGGQTHNPTIHLASAVENFYYCAKGNPTLAIPGRTNAFNYAPVPPANKTHPTERPIELMDAIISTFSMPGGRILVPFGGSGNTLLSAWKLGIQGVCYDLGVDHKEAYNVKALKFLESEGNKDEQQTA